ncbi:LysR family transcriptional regulator [Dyadobacter sp. 32]|uniref:winged helix-turn-helix domain-containing protein n=1 Tax=Dyadobacter sp. 32 TaxID=538966 RepID=UPI0011EF3A12
MKKKIELHLAHWVFVDDVKFFGKGRLQLLELIQETGSISKAAKEMGMSYKKAWRMVDELNTFGKSPYVIASKGGIHGGGTEVTETGKQVMDAYHRLGEKLQTIIEQEKNLLDLI